MVPIKVLAKGDYGSGDLVVSVSESNRKIDPKVEGQLDAIWDATVKKAREEGRTNLYNGLSYRLNSIKEEGGKLFLDFGIFDFKTRDGLFRAEGFYELGEDYYRKGAHSIATVKTADDKYLLVELSGKSMNTNKLDFVGGVMETDVKYKAGDDVFQAIYKELEEEAIISLSDISSAKLKMVYVEPKTNVGFYFEVKLNVTSGELMKKFEQKSKDKDIKSLKVFTREEYVKTLEGINPNKKFVSTIIEI